MMFLGTLVNCIAVVVGSGIGLVVKKGISEKISTSIMNALALCVLYIGVKGAFECQNVLVVIVSMALGTFIGEWIDFDAGEIHKPQNVVLGYFALLVFDATVGSGGDDKFFF